MQQSYATSISRTAISYLCETVKPKHRSTARCSLDTTDHLLLSLEVAAVHTSSANSMVRYTINPSQHFDYSRTSLENQYPSPRTLSTSPKNVFDKWRTRTISTIDYTRTDISFHFSYPISLASLTSSYYLLFCIDLIHIPPTNDIAIRSHRSFNFWTLVTQWLRFGDIL